MKISTSPTDLDFLVETKKRVWREGEKSKHVFFSLKDMYTVGIITKDQYEQSLREDIEEEERNDERSISKKGLHRSISRRSISRGSICMRDEDD